MPELAPYAVHPQASRGRKWPEPPAGMRSEFQRDRDRIVHSTSFRRLEYKTQVFVNHEGDHFRTRLTHSLEVAQIARSISRSLGLNEDLVEAIALAHDLGHTPFGHAGQEALNQCMREHGGFEHNLQSLRVVDALEQRYAEFDGLNLTFETREGIVKHCSRGNARELGDVGKRFLTGNSPSLEAQVTNLADEIAYNNHDVDDGLRSGVLSLDQLQEVALFDRHHRAVLERYPALTGRRLVHETVRRMIDTLVADLIRCSRDSILAHRPGSVADVRAGPVLIAFGPELTAQQQALKEFLRRHLYRDYRVNRMMAKAKRIIRELYQAFTSEPSLLPPDYRQRHEREGVRAVADYIAGMTDRYAVKEHKRLFTIGED
ncbi:MAG: deoxyguanosinetriphosphate triphosphohydrolase [Burkholderiales bacterium]|nr:deoxyguanosinetriphosphate triphosphohydrolase [Burkholderiales bacterium]